MGKLETGILDMGILEIGYARDEYTRTWTKAESGVVNRSQVPWVTEAWLNVGHGR